MWRANRRAIDERDIQSHAKIHVERQVRGPCHDLLSKAYVTHPTLMAMCDIVLTIRNVEETISKSCRENLGRLDHIHLMEQIRWAKG